MEGEQHQQNRLSRGLGWFSVALGAAPPLNPGAVAWLAGVDPKPRNLALLRVVGVRELAVAAGLLRTASPGSVWARVAQDAVDLPLTARALRGKRGARRTRTQVTFGVLLVITALDVYAALRTSRVRSSPTTCSELSSQPAGNQPAGRTPPMTARAAITIRRPEEEVRARWAEAEPPLSDAAALVSYASAPGRRGTEVRVVLDPDTSPGLGKKLGAVTGTDPQRQLEDALRRYKQVLETGQVLRSEGSPGGVDATQQRAQRPAQPVGTDR